ncbi:aldehyde dehydrogenase family protein [Acuticoccus sp. M5D2P5]|uniref:aldehyde dehydrogenase family protein n=1 Tax=Acuticoccus kalidii TaxID=2910977 RepID=UPI001F2EB63E|nr:aldehyde dehydrogenase family protein [Acuticoccus kalidii]MCF3936371.1 aldehyde dehydrogenase family protein [Acuticoccus kalidii]
MTKINIVSPVDGSVYAERPIATDSAIDTALTKARVAQAAWRGVPIAERARLLSAAVDAMLVMRDEIVPELAWQMGRPIRFGAGELGGFEERARHMIAIAEAALAPIVPAPKDGFTRMIKREPLGTVFVVAPWNYPYLTAVNSVVPALMAGNAVILKCAAQTLLTGERFAAAFAAAGLPDGLFHNLVMTHDQAARIIGSGRIAQVNFTGSVAGGRAMESAASGHFLGVGLELGGKDPAYVRADADLGHAVESLVDGAFFNSGQSCCGIERIYVHADVYDAFVDGAVALTHDYVLGSPLDEATTLGPMVKASAADAVRDQIDEAVAKGARALIDPSAFAREARGSAYMAPQIVVDVDHTMSLMREESFGPAVGIMKVANDAEAVALMNDSPYGLTAAIWTRDVEMAQSLGDTLETGTVFMNRCDYLDPALAWTGVKDTGRGATLSRVGYETLTRPKSFHLRHAQ